MRFTPDSDFFMRVAAGEIDGLRSVYKFGRVESISSGDGDVVVWNNGGNYNFPLANNTLSIVSDSIDDAVGGGGATEITIVYLEEIDGEWIEKTMVKPLTGTTPVITTEQAIRINRMFISAGEDRSLAVGSTPIAANHGKITVTHAGTGLPLSVISPNRGQTLQAVYTVPSNYNAYTFDADGNTGEASDGEFSIYIRENVTGNEVFRVQGTREAFQSNVGQVFKAIGELKPKTDIAFTFKTSKSNKNASATFQLIEKLI